MSGLKKKSNRTSRTRTSAKNTQRGRVRRLIPSVLTIGVALLIVAGIGLLPAKTWLNQRESIANAQADLDRVNSEIAELENQLELLETDEEIERTARENFDLVYPGEESYRILPAPESSSSD